VEKDFRREEGEIRGIGGGGQEEVREGEQGVREEEEGVELVVVRGVEFLRLVVVRGEGEEEGGVEGGLRHVDEARDVA